MLKLILFVPLVTISCLKEADFENRVCRKLGSLCSITTTNRQYNVFYVAIAPIAVYV